MGFVKRVVLDEIRLHLEKPEITVITGPRQCGKTTIMKILENELNARGKKTLFMNLDVEEDMAHFSSQNGLLRKIELEIGSEGYVFIDEIQRKENAGRFLKGIYDMNRPYKFIVSGSGSIELKVDLQESLAGRKRIFEVSTISFEEFVNYKTDYRYEGKLEHFFEIEKAKTHSLLEEYLNFGGYPRVILEQESKEKREIIREIYQSYIERDITYLLHIARPEQFSLLVKVLSLLDGKILNLSNLSSEVGISIKTVKQYLWYLEKTCIIDKVSPFSTNPAKELTKAPICYFKDIGLRNYAAGEFGNISDYGFAFQNFIYLQLSELAKRYDFSIHFWRTKDRAEVDFILQKGRQIIPIEVKYKNINTFEITKSMRNFIERYNPEAAAVINISSFHEESIANTKTSLLPFYKLRTFVEEKFSSQTNNDTLK
ncbi:MAG TPA: ATP-binding protein [Fervidobacterium sp.]|nr:ATP-binding protein [Fervidobacterium sp.]